VDIVSLATGEDFSIAHLGDQTGLFFLKRADDAKSVRFSVHFFSFKGPEAA
jgi:hypothetical protein